MNNSICKCVFIKKSKINFVIIIVYVDDLNLLGTLEFIKTTKYLKN